MSILTRIIEQIGQVVFGVRAGVEELVAKFRDLPKEEIEARLDHRATTLGGNLQWRTSIVDLLKTIGLGTALDARKELAGEFNEQLGAEYKGTAEQNLWLHKQVLTEIGKHGIELPPCE